MLLMDVIKSIFFLFFRSVCHVVKKGKAPKARKKVCAVCVYIAQQLNKFCKLNLFYILVTVKMGITV